LNLNFIKNNLKIYNFFKARCQISKPFTWYV